MKQDRRAAEISQRPVFDERALRQWLEVGVSECRKMLLIHMFSKIESLIPSGRYKKRCCLCKTSARVIIVFSDWSRVEIPSGGHPDGQLQFSNGGQKRYSASNDVSDQFEVTVCECNYCLRERTGQDSQRRRW